MTLVLAPLRIEAWALGARRTGMGRRTTECDGPAVVIAGLCGAVDPSLRPGDLVVASEIRGDGEPIRCDTSLAERLGAHIGPIVSVPRIAGRRARQELRASGAAAVDMESYWLAAGAGERPVAVVRAVVDTADRRLLDPRTPAAAVKGLHALRRAAPVLHAWSPR